MAVFGDESSVKDPQEFVNNFRDKCKEVINDPEAHGLVKLE